MTNPFELAEKSIYGAWYKDLKSKAIVAIVPGSIDWVNQKCSIEYLLSEMNSETSMTSQHDFNYMRTNLEAVEKPKDADRITIRALEEFTRKAFREVQAGAI